MEAPKRKDVDARTELWNQLQGLPKHIAMKMHLKYGLPLDELIEEARSLLGYHIARDRYNSSRGKPMTWFYTILSFQLRDYCTRKRDRMIHFSTEDTEFEPAGKKSPVQNLLMELGAEAKELVTLILHAPEEIVDDMTFATKGRARKSLQQYLTSTRGWSRPKLETVWAEVEAALA